MTTKQKQDIYNIFTDEAAMKILQMETVTQEMQFVFPKIEEIPESHKSISILFLKLYGAFVEMRSDLNNQIYRTKLDPEVIGDPECFKLTHTFLDDQIRRNETDNQWLLSYINHFVKSIIVHECYEPVAAVFIALINNFLDDNVFNEFIFYLHNFYDIVVILNGWIGGLNEVWPPRRR